MCGRRVGWEGSEWLAWHAMASAGVGVCIQLNPWHRLGQNKGKSGHKLKVLAGRQESVERQLCDYLTVRLEFSSLFSLHTLRASLKYCSSSTYPRCCFCFASLSLAYVCIFMYVRVCICKLMASVCLWRVSMQHAHSAESQNSQIR